MLETIGQQKCDDLHQATKIILDATKKDRNVQAHIEEIITLAANSVYCGDEGQVAPIEDIKSFLLH